LRARGGAALAALSDDRLAAAFLDTVNAFRDPGSPERRRLDPALRESAQLSAGTLDASLDALLDGFDTVEVGAVLASARRAIERPRAMSSDPHLIVLAANLPGVALAPLLASLAVRRPAILKSSSREPFFAAHFVDALTAREPAFGDAVETLAWRGGEASVEGPLLACVDRVVAYGGTTALAALRRRAGDRLVAFGPKASVALVTGDVAIDVRAEALARDVALFDQRGCLSLQAIYTDGDAGVLATALAPALDDAARRWPPHPLSPAEAAALRLLREEAAFLGSTVEATPLEHGTVIVDRRALFLPSPGHRTVRVHPVADLEQALSILEPHGARLQGAAVAGEAALDCEGRLAAIGVSYVCAPGRLQSPGASWRNGGIDLIAELAATTPRPDS
jgi:hypothetical protein